MRYPPPGVSSVTVSSRDATPLLGTPLAVSRTSVTADRAGTVACSTRFAGANNVRAAVPGANQPSRSISTVAGALLVTVRPLPHSLTTAELARLLRAGA